MLKRLNKGALSLVTEIDLKVSASHVSLPNQQGSGLSSCL